MSRSPAVVAGCWALVLCAWGQQAQRGGRNRPFASAIQPGLVQQLYAQARQAAQNAPALVAPAILRQIGVDELRPYTRDTDETALDDLTAAFSLALALPTNTGDPDLDPVRAQIKAETEEQVVAELARHGQQQQALQLTRMADVPKAPLYGQIIASAARPDWSHWNDDDDEPSDPAEAQKEQNLFDSVVALVAECERASGEYPYRGVTELLRRDGPRGLERMLLVEDGYERAANETDPARIDTAVMFLHAGHDAEPELDVDLQSTILAMLNRLAQISPTDDAGAVHNAAPRLFELLRDLDPLAAASWQAQWPTLVPATGPQFPEGYDFSVQALQTGGTNFQVVVPRGLPPPSSISLVLHNGRPAMLISTTVTATAPDPGLQTTGAERFRVLVAEAESERHSHSAQALSYADQASSMLNHSLWPTVSTTAIRLVAIYQGLGASADAGRLLQNCLDEADREARELDAEFTSGPASQQASLARDLNLAGAAVLSIYSQAARSDFSTTAERAETASFTLLKPLVLARLALLRTVEQRRSQHQSQSRQP
ncbi:MAG: hypothetical protein ACRD1C_05390 [Terriglobales bacterium]